MLELSLLAFIAPGASQAAELPAGWSAVTGDGWGKTVDFHTMLILRGSAGPAAAVNQEARGSGGAWRCFVQPSLGAQACGIWFLANEDLTAGFRCELGGNPSSNRGRLDPTPTCRDFRTFSPRTGGERRGERRKGAPSCRCSGGGVRLQG